MTMPLRPTTATRPPGDATADGARTCTADGGTDGGRVASGADSSVDSGIGVGSAEWDLLTDEVRWNAETYLLLGCEPGTAPLSLDRLPDRLPEADRPLLRRMMTDALVHGRPSAGTVRVRRVGGRHDGVECAGEPVLGPDGTVTALRMRLRPAPVD
ncbi:hypothetical protein [Streptomyces sp. NRRL WC-3742]|uniref:hypothetical protein n=1 Tax=Streptomyces sp. NRRL WC-3742 TaxID=1463934 RepID=UPI0004C74404|nr:hypothetical protein [Streptomyces sp. NRRL WC-3742]